MAFVRCSLESRALVLDGILLIEVSLVDVLKVVLVLIIINDGSWPMGKVVRALRYCSVISKVIMMNKMNNFF